MSLKKEEDKLDLMVRSVMENAEEPVPEHLWDAISGRLDAVEALSKKVPVFPVWLGRAAVGMAAAAAIALGVFLFVTGRHSGVQDESIAVVTPSESGTHGVASEDSDSPHITLSPGESQIHGISGSGESASDVSRNAIAAVTPSAPGSSPAGSSAAPSSVENSSGAASSEASSSGKNSSGASSSGIVSSGGASSDEGLSSLHGEDGKDDGTVRQREDESGSAGRDEGTSLGSEEDVRSAGSDEGAVREREDGAESGTEEISGEGGSGWSDAFSDEASGSGQRKVHTAITMSGNAMGNAGSTTASASGIHRQMSSSIVQQTTTGITRNSDSSYGIPTSFGIGVKIIFTPRWSLGVGVNYSLLTSTFAGTYTSYSTESESYSSVNYSKIRNNISYIGIQVNAYFSIVKSHIVDFYAYAGGTAEKLIGNRYVLEDDGLFKGSTKGFQFSADVGIGVEFIIVDMVGIYIDPSLRYYFPNDSQPKSIRTQEPLNFGFEIGLRIRL